MKVQLLMNVLIITKGVESEYFPVKIMSFIVINIHFITMHTCLLLPFSVSDF